jgi:hypothetical protein
MTKTIPTLIPGNSREREAFVLRRSLVLSGLLILVLAGLTIAGRMERKQQTVEPGDVDKVVVHCDLGAGQFTITPVDMKQLADVDIEYDSRRVDVSVDYSIKRSTGYLDLESDGLERSDLHTDDNIWNVKLSNRYPARIEMDIGACDANFDLGGIPVEELSLDVGAASGKVDFSKRNPIRMREMDVNAGASSLDMKSIGNANFDEMTFDGGVGSFDLDFRGKYEGESTIEIEIGLGSADITLPHGVPIQVETEGSNWLSSVDLHGGDLDEIDDGLYESKDFAHAKDRITLRIKVGLGSADIYWRD